MKAKPLYIETTIQCSLEKLWELTQDPEQHQQWDLRFSRIAYLPKTAEEQPQRFTYATRIGFGVEIKGVGESVANKTGANGVRTSVLNFYADSPLSLIRQGSGYWKYIPQGAANRFITGYDYHVRWSVLGQWIDRWLFRPLMNWATAWSFDCLKNWLEQGIHPRQALRASLTVTCARLGLAIIWLYQGIVPKLLFTDTGELTLLIQSNLLSGYERGLLTAVGLAEIAFGLVILWRANRWVYGVNIAALIGLALGAWLSDASVFVLPFNPFSLNLAMIALSVNALLQLPFMPRANNCLTKTPL